MRSVSVIQSAATEVFQIWRATPLAGIRELKSLLKNVASDVSVLRQRCEDTSQGNLVSRLINLWNQVFSLISPNFLSYQAQASHVKATHFDPLIQQLSMASHPQNFECVKSEIRVN